MGTVAYAFAYAFVPGVAPSPAPVEPLEQRVEWVPTRVTGSDIVKILKLGPEWAPTGHTSIETFEVGELEKGLSKHTALLVDAPAPVSSPAVLEQVRNYSTTDFSKDTEQVLLARMLFGEARGCSDEERRVIAATAIHRANLGGWYGKGIHGVILKDKQFSCFNKDDKNYAKIQDPAKYDLPSFEKCLTVAKEMLSKRYVLSPKLARDLECDLDFHATHYHTPKKIPSWALTGVRDGKLLPVNYGGASHMFYLAPIARKKFDCK